VKDAVPRDTHVDFRIVFNETDFAVFVKKKKVVDHQRKHIARVKKSREKAKRDKENEHPFFNPKYEKIDEGRPNPFIDKKKIQGSLLRS